MARVQLPVALSSLTQGIILVRGLVKCVAIGKQWVTAIEDCEGSLGLTAGAAMHSHVYPVYRPLQDLLAPGYGSTR